MFIFVVLSGFLIFGQINAVTLKAIEFLLRVNKMLKEQVHSKTDKWCSYMYVR